MPRVRVFVHSNIDTSLVIRSAGGGVYCDDDSEGLNPVVDEAFVAGRYEIFVASADGTQRVEYTLGISEHGRFSPRSFAPRDHSSMRSGTRRRRSQMRGLGSSESEVIDPFADTASEESFFPEPSQARPPAMIAPAAPILR